MNFFHIPLMIGDFRNNAKILAPLDNSFEGYIIGRIIMHRIPRNQIKPFVLKQGPDVFLSELPKMDIVSMQQKQIAQTIHYKYPLVSKVAIIVIMRTAFEIMRELVIKGCILDLGPLFNDLKLYFFQHRRKTGKIYPSVRISITTPKNIKDHNVK